MVSDLLGIYCHHNLTQYYSTLEIRQIPLLSTEFGPGVVEMWADADQEGRTWPVKPTSQARTGKRKGDEAVYWKNNKSEKIVRMQEKTTGGLYSHTQRADYGCACLLYTSPSPRDS